MSNEGYWAGDLNDAVVEEWVAATSNFDRVRQVLRTTTTPQYARKIAERARVSEPTARAHLETLTEAGFGRAVETGRGHKYKRSPQQVAMQRILEIHATVTKEELVDEIQELRRQIEGYRARFDAADPDDLAFQLEEGTDDAWQDVAAWRGARNNLEVAKAALALYDYNPDEGSSLGGPVNA